MKFSPAHYLLPLLPALVLSTRQNYHELERKLKEIAKERSIMLHQMAKNSRELVGIKSNLQSLKNDEKNAKDNVQKLLLIGTEQREQLKSLQETLHIQLKEATDKAEKQQTTIVFLKSELERKNKMIRDLQNENKSLKNKLLAGNKLCGIHAEEAKKIQAQLKDIHYGKKDLLLKAQLLTELEQKLVVARNELEKAALDRESQMKAMKETIRLCLSTVFNHNSPTDINIPQINPTLMALSNAPTVSVNAHEQTQQQIKIPDIPTLPGQNDSIQYKSSIGENITVPSCNPNEGCSMTVQDSIPRNDTLQNNITTQMQELHIKPCAGCEENTNLEKQLTSFEGTTAREEKIL